MNFYKYFGLDRKVPIAEENVTLEYNILMRRLMAFFILFFMGCSHYETVELSSFHEPRKFKIKDSLFMVSATKRVSFNNDYDVLVLEFHHQKDSEKFQSISSDQLIVSLGEGEKTLALKLLNQDELKSFAAQQELTKPTASSTRKGFPLGASYHQNKNRFVSTIVTRAPSSQSHDTYYEYFFLPAKRFDEKLTLKYQGPSSWASTELLLHNR